MCLHICLSVCLFVYLFICWFVGWLFFRTPSTLQKSSLTKNSRLRDYFPRFTVSLNKFGCIVGPGWGGVLPSKRLLGMCRWMGSHFHNWTDYNGVTFLVELLGRKFSGFLG